MKMTMLKDLKLDRIIDNYNIIINGKNFYDHTIDSDTKQYEEIRKLTTGQGEDYTNVCLSDYNYIRNHYRLIVIDLSKLKELDVDPKAVHKKNLLDNWEKQMIILMLNICLF